MAQASELKMLECPSPCSFSIRSHDEKEIIEMAMQHAQKKHNMTVTEQDLRQMIKPA
jgi:predicted small metal-binding protein